MNLEKKHFPNYYRTRNALKTEADLQHFCPTKNGLEQRTLIAKQDHRRRKGRACDAECLDGPSRRVVEGVYPGREACWCVCRGDGGVCYIGGLVCVLGRRGEGWCVGLFVCSCGGLSGLLCVCKSVRGV